MPLSARELNRATLARQLLLEREPLGVQDAMRRVVAVQAQEPASPYLALWNRVVGFRPADLDAAFADRSIVKASLLRITLHAVRASDYGPFHNAMVESLRASRVYDKRFKESGLSFAELDALLPHLVGFASEPRSVAELEAALAERLGAPRERAWWALRTFAPLWHVPTGGPWSFGRRPSFIASGVDRADQDASIQVLIRRYLEGFGPASPRDFAQFTLLSQAVTKSAFAALAEELDVVEGPDGKPLLDLPGAARPAADTPAPPRLLGMWDNVLLAYFDRSRVVPPEYRTLVTRRNGDVLPTLLVDGYVAGVWRPVDGGIEASAFRTLPAATWNALATEAKALVALLGDRDPRVYSRYRRWWDSLPAAQVRVLPA